MTTQIDPVCGMEVNVENAVNTLEYEGKTYYFCSRGCMLDFQEDPEKYMSADYQPEGM
jgi:YHS domain-containing protein